MTAECTAILNQLPQVRELVDHVIAALQQQQILPATHVHTPRAVYTLAVTDLIPRLPTAERNLLHVAYEHLRVADEFLDGYGRDLLADLREGVIDDPWAAYESHLRDIATSLDTVQGLLGSYLKGEPIDPFPPSSTG